MRHTWSLVLRITLFLILRADNLIPIHKRAFGRKRYESGESVVTKQDRDNSKKFVWDDEIGQCQTIPRDWHISRMCTRPSRYRLAWPWPRPLTAEGRGTIHKWRQGHIPCQVAEAPTRGAHVDDRPHPQQDNRSHRLSQGARRQSGRANASLVWNKTENDDSRMRDRCAAIVLAKPVVNSLGYSWWFCKYRYKSVPVFGSWHTSVSNAAITPR